MAVPGRFIGEPMLGIGFQPGDHRSRQGALTHVIQRLGVDHVVTVSGAQHLQEIQPAFGAGGGEGGEVVVADLGAETVLSLCRAPVYRPKGVA